MNAVHLLVSTIAKFHENQSTTFYITAVYLLISRA